VRDSAGKLLMQFDYPSDDLCARTSSAMRGSAFKAGCSAASMAEPLRGRATLRYNPPGVLVEGHYADLASWRPACPWPSRVRPDKRYGPVAAELEVPPASGCHHLPLGWDARTKAAIISADSRRLAFSAKLIAVIPTWFFIVGSAPASSSSFTAAGVP
jgi:hypothetical protein